MITCKVPLIAPRSGLFSTEVAVIYTADSDRQGSSGHAGRTHVRNVPEVNARIFVWTTRSATAAWPTEPFLRGPAFGVLASAIHYM